jgi:hypothetical protein
MWQEAAVANFEILSGIFLERLRKGMKNLSQNSRRADRDSNRSPPEYISKALPLELTTNTTTTNTSSSSSSNI